jgi:hypothetical protein
MKDSVEYCDKEFEIGESAGRWYARCRRPKDHPYPDLHGNSDMTTWYRREGQKLWPYLAVACFLLFAGCAMGGSTYTFKGAGSCAMGACAGDQSTVTGSVGGFADPQQIVYMSGPGCTPPPSVATPIYVPPAAPVAYQMKHMCGNGICGDFLTPVPVTNVPACNVQSVTTSGGPTLTTWAAVAGGLAGLFYLLFK